MLFQLTLISLVDTKDHIIGLYTKFQNLCPINNNSFQRKPEIKASPQILQ